MIIRIKKNVLYGVLWSAFLFVVAFILIAFLGIKERELVSIDIKAEVINTTTNISKIGVSVDTDMLNFGRMIVNKTNMTKILVIENPASLKSIIYLYFEGNASPYIIAPREGIVLNPKEKRNIYLRFYAKDVGNYSGKVMVVAKYPTNVISEWLLVRFYA